MTADNRDARAYGDGDASFQAAGGEDGILRLVEEFYRLMDTLPECGRIRRMHPADLETSIDKLARFLCGWLGGPKRYREKFGPIKIPQIHRHFPIAEPERDAWLHCMEKAVSTQPYAEDFKEYLMVQLAIPAERVRAACERRQAEGAVSGPGPEGNTSTR